MRILVAGAVHEKEHIFKEHLESIRNLELPADTEINSLYILHNSEHLKHLLHKENYMIYNNKTDYNKDENTHHWQHKNFKDVVKMKNLLIDKALDLRFDYILFVDSDIVMHPKALKSLVFANKDMISNIFWTQWQPNDIPMPNAWDYDFYSFHKNTMEKLKTRGYHKVGMTGACTLIKRKVLKTGINWNPIYNLSYSYWEDRAFCTRVAMNNFEIWTDTNYPAIHLYRESCYDEFIKNKGLKT